MRLLARTPPTDEQEIDVRVDPRVELVSILFQMAGRDEYNMTRVSAWQESVQEHFQPFADHPAVRMTERLAGGFGVGFFVPMNLAVHLSDPPEFAERSPPHRRYTVNFFPPGYKAVRRAVILRDGETTTVDVVLQEK